MFRNITLSVEASLIEKARRRAAGEHKTLNQIFREWMARYVGGDTRAKGYPQLMQRLSHVRTGRSFSREEMNER